MLPKQILVVEDEHITRVDIENRLKEVGYEVCAVADSGEQALQEAAAKSVDLALLDIRLNGMLNGIETAEVLQSRYDIPVVFLTAYSDDHTVQCAKQVGPLGFIVKPFRTQELHRTVELALRQHEMNQMLRHSEERFRKIFEENPLGMLLVSLDFNFTRANAKICQLLGYTERELTTLGFSDITPPEDIGADWHNAQKLLRGEIPSYQTHKRYITKHEESLQVALTLSLARDRGEPDYFVAMVEDISGYKRMEQELIQLERMRARSDMAQGISHNLNNLLSGIVLPAEILFTTLDDPESRMRAELILQSSVRASELVRRLSRAVQSKEETPQAVEVLPLVQEVVEGTQPRWKTAPESRGISIDLVTELSAMPPIRGTSSELYDMLVNLIFNAVDAMPEGGMITLSSEARADYVELTVRDTGIGMDEDVCSRVFEPFFTTKVNVGSGLGLYTVYTTVSNWGGDVSVQSIPGEGTTFTLRLPVWTATQGAQDKDIAERQTVTSG